MITVPGICPTTFCSTTLQDLEIHLRAASALGKNLLVELLDTIRHRPVIRLKLFASQGWPLSSKLCRVIFERLSYFTTIRDLDLHICPAWHTAANLTVLTGLFRSLTRFRLDQDGGGWNQLVLPDDECFPSLEVLSVSARWEVVDRVLRCLSPSPVRLMASTSFESSAKGSKVRDRNDYLPSSPLMDLMASVTADDLAIEGAGRVYTRFLSKWV